MTGTDPRAARAADEKTSLTDTLALHQIRALINELEEEGRLATREMEAEAVWIRRMQDQTAQHLDALLQMRTTLDAIQSWIGGGPEL